MTANLQQQVADFAQRHDLLHDPAIHALDLVSEVGEVAKALLLDTDYGQRTPRPNGDLAVELGDALYSLLALAQVCGVNAEQALEMALTKYSHRLEARGTAGSR